MPCITYSHDEVMDALVSGVAAVGAGATGVTVEHVLRTGFDVLAANDQGPPVPDAAALVLTVTPGTPPTLAVTVDTAVKKRGRRAKEAAPPAAVAENGLVAAQANAWTVKTTADVEDAR